MKILVRLALGLVALVTLALVALALLLPRIVASEAVREQIQVASYDALGRELRYEELGFALFPLSLVVVQPVIAGEKAGDAPFLEARAISLELALLPLLARAVVVDKLLVDGGVVRLVRTEEGVALPGPVEEPGGEAAPPPPAEESAGEGSGFRLAVREVELRDTRIVFDDLVSSPPASWVIDPIQATAVGTSLDAPITVQASAAIESGGKIGVEGTVDPDGVLDLEIAVERLVVDPVSAYLGGDLSLAGVLDGAVVVKGPAGSPRSVGLDLSLADLHAVAPGAAALGVVSLEAELSQPVDHLAGRFRLDAADAEIRSGDAFVKPRGTEASVAGRIETGEDGVLRVEDIELVLHRLKARARADIGDATRVRVSSAGTDLAGWEELVPALGEMRLSGSMRLEDLEVTLEPLAVRGRLEIADGVVELPDVAPVSFRGAFVATGNGLRGEGLALGTAGQELAIGLQIRDLMGALVLDLEALGEDLDTNRLVTELAGQPDTVLGPLDLSVELAGPLAAEGELLDALRGKLVASIEKGRIVGFSPLREVFDQVGGLGSAAAQLAQAFTRRSIQDYYSDEFERAGARFKLAEGVVEDALDIKYRGYSVALEGTIDPRNFGLDNTGTVILADDLDAIIARELGARDYHPRARSIPLASVTGPLDAPEIRVSKSQTATFVAQYTSDIYGATARKVIESEASKHVGDAAGKALGEAAGGLLGDLLGGQKRQKPQEEP